jgi:hypothetical protein
MGVVSYNVDKRYTAVTVHPDKMGSDDELANNGTECDGVDG